MKTVTVTRTIPASEAEVRDAILDVGPFMEAAGFDEVDVDGEMIRVTNSVGIVDIELVLEILEDPEAVLVYEQREGIFQEMRTEYSVSPVADGVEVNATTLFGLPGSVVGDVLDGTIIKRQRTKELEAQLNHLEERVT